MGATNSTTCPQCGSALSDEGLYDLCLKCLGRFGLGAEAGEGDLLRLGDYELLEEIARGGMGVVYRARQLSLNRIVALKVVLHGPFSSPDFVRRFRNEAEATATLRHPNIIPIYEVGEYDGHHFLSMEFIDGQNLADLVREQPLSARRAAGYAKSIAEAVHHAHQRGVLHRDLKPSNVLLDAFDQPRVTDFGLAKILDHDAEITVTGQVLGSPNHMPPEQAAGNLSQATAQSDIYSLGSILYQLIAGRPPFQGATLSELLAQVQGSEPIPPRHLNPGVPADLQSICLKCLQKEPSRRYRSARELAEDLGRFLDQKSVLARPVSSAEKAWRWCRRRPLLTALWFSLVLVVLAGLGGILWQWRRAEFHAQGEKAQRIAAEANAATTRLNLYAADVNLAAQAVEDGDYGLARRTLDGLRPHPGEEDLRGFEWRYLWNLSRGNQIATLAGHQWIVTGATFSPDGRLIVSCGMGGEARVWDVAGRACIRKLDADSHSLWSVAFTPDGKTLMTAGNDGIQFWNTGSWQKITNYPGRLAVLSRDGTTVAISESSPFYVQEIGAVTLWNWRTGEKLRTFGQEGRVLSLSPDGRFLAMAGESTGIILWDVAQGTLLKNLPTEHPVWSLNFSPDGRHLVSAGWCGQALVWDWATGSPPRVISANRLNLWSVIFSPDGSTIATTGSDQTVRLWDANTLLPKAVLHGHANEVWCAAFSTDGKLLVTGGKDQNVLLWQTAFNSRPQMIPIDDDYPPLFSPAGDRLFCRPPEGNDAGVLWNIETMEAVARFPGPNRKPAGFSPDGRELIFPSEDGTSLEFWRPGTTAPSHVVVLVGPPAPKGGVVDWGMSPERNYYFDVDREGLIRIWKSATGTFVRSLQGPAPPIRNMVLSRYGRWLAVSVERENGVHFFDCITGEEKQLLGHKDFVSGLAYPPDGTTLATGSIDGTIRLWDTASGALRATLPGHMQETTDVAFSPDGRTLASIGKGESLKLWHIPTLREVYSEQMPQAGTWLRFSPDGRRLAVGTSTNQVRLLEAPIE
jgi:eukaryotic-like serine/threonine-protein kinase